MKRIKFIIPAPRFITVLSLVLCLLIMTVMSGYSQSKITDNMRDSALRIPKPNLNGHKFITNALVKDPFVRTHIRNSLGIGQTLDFETPVLILNGNKVVSLKGDLLYTSIDFEYQQEIRDWLAFSGRFQVAGRMGTEVSALFTNGINFITGLELGWMVKAFENRNMALSGHMKVTSNSGTYVNLYDFIQGVVIDSGKITVGNKLVKSTPLTRVLGGARTLLIRYSERTRCLKSVMARQLTGT
jgi:hypothetical protein